MHIAGSTFLVSGGGSGLGAACVRLLAGAGANVVIADLNADTGQRLAAELGDRVRFARTDVADETSVRAAVQSALQTFGDPCKDPFSVPASALRSGCSARMGHTRWQRSRRSFA